MKILKFIVIIFLLPIFLISCFKSSNQPDLKDIAGSKIFEIDPFSEDLALAGPIDSVRDTKSVLRDTALQVIEIPILIRSNSGSFFSNDVTVYLEQDTAAIYYANIRLHKSDPVTKANYAILPSSIDVTPKPYSVTIPAGKQVGYFKVYIKSSLINNTDVYKDQIKDMISYKISKVTDGGVISNSRASVQYPIALRNKYEAKYSALGYFYHPASPRTFTRSVTLSTVDDSTISKVVGDLSGYAVNFTITSNNKITVSTPSGPFPGTGVYSLFPKLPTINPGYTAPNVPGKWNSVSSDSCSNYYNPATRTLYLRYGYTGGTGYRIIEEILKRQ